MKVLLVEDNPTNAEVARTILEAEGHVVFGCRDGAEALLHCLERQEPFDLILMDLSMPRMDGFTAIARLREHAATRPIPVMCVTASALASSQRTAELVGADHYVIKPYRRSELLEAIAVTLKKRRAS